MDFMMVLLVGFFVICFLALVVSKWKKPGGGSQVNAAPNRRNILIDRLVPGSYGIIMSREDSADGRHTRLAVQNENGEYHLAYNVNDLVPLNKADVAVNNGPTLLMDLKTISTFLPEIKLQVETLQQERDEYAEIANKASKDYQALKLSFDEELDKRAKLILEGKKAEERSQFRPS